MAAVELLLCGLKVAVAQVARAIDVDVAHRVVVGPRKDRGPASGSSLSQKVTNAPISFVKARATVTLRSAAPGGTVDCCVCSVG